VATTLAEFLADRDEPCPSCGYNLRGMQSGVCPECRQELVLGVQLAEPKLKAFIATVLGLAVGGGFSAMLVGYVIVSEVAMRRASVPPDFFRAVIPGVVVCGVPLAVLLVKRRAFSRLSEVARVGWAVLAWILAIGNLVYFTAFVR
jgi:hypothetical protein